MMFLQSKKILLFIPIILFSSVLMAKPIAPSFDPIKPSETISSGPIKTIPKTVPDLPYQPGNVPSDDLGDGSLDEQKDQQAIDWNKIPFIPSKSPLFKPVRDPDFE